MNKWIPDWAADLKSQPDADLSGNATTENKRR